MAHNGMILYSPGSGRHLEGTVVGCTTVGGTGVGSTMVGGGVVLLLGGTAVEVLRWEALMASFQISSLFTCSLGAWSPAKLVR